MKRTFLALLSAPLLALALGSPAHAERWDGDRGDRRGPPERHHD